MSDSKWRFCFRLKRFYRTCFIADSRVSAHYECGWNDAVSSLMASIRPLYKGQEPFLKTLLEGTEQPIPRATVAAAMCELREAIAGESTSLENFVFGNKDIVEAENATVELALQHVDATITKLGLEEQ